jgi:hypothetical protein
MGELRDVSDPAGTLASDTVKRRQAWTKGAPGRVIEQDGVGWWEARQRGVLLKRRQELGDLLDVLDLG